MPMTSENPVLAVYDFRSKQAYIYRTNYMREITGASELIAGMYKRLLSPEATSLLIRNDWDKPTARPLFNTDGTVKLDDGEAGAVVYEGGGNLLVLFRDRATYLQANKAFSRIVASEAHTLGLIAGCTTYETSEGSSFEQNRSRAYADLDRCKRIGPNSTPSNVLPYTLVNRVTFQPIVERTRLRDSRTGEGDMLELTREAKAKRAAFDAKAESERRKGHDWLAEGHFIDDLGTSLGDDSLIAVLYFDGNSIGEKVKSAVLDGRAKGKSDIDAMREFSVGLHHDLVDATEQAMKHAIDALPEKYRGYRVIVDHGDEITLVCNAHAAPIALNAYFSAIASSDHHACGGMAICHAHDPFAEVYRIAEECCESGKVRNRTQQREGSPDTSYVDFHFCRAGITGTLEQTREAQEGGLSARPYAIGGSYEVFLRVGRILGNRRCKLTRTDLKQLNRAILRGRSWYRMELERLKAKDAATIGEIEAAVGTSASMMQVLFDVTSFWDVFDLCFTTDDPTHQNGGE